MSIRLLDITTAVKKADMAEAHALFYKPESEYWHGYASGFLRAIHAVGVPVRAPDTPQVQFVSTWRFGDGTREKTVTLGHCYDDYGPNPDGWRGVDGLLAMRWHPPRFADRNYSCPVWGAGFPLSVGAGSYDHDTFIREDLPALRHIKDGSRQVDDLFFNVASFRKFGGRGYPNRDAFKRNLSRHIYSHVKFQKAPAWLRGIATHRWALNVCGNGNSIDRKVPILCAIGTAIISDRGLEDLALPNGCRFEHGKNIWFIDGPEGLEGAMAEVQGETWRTLVDGSRRLYEQALSPAAGAVWYRRCAESVL